LEREHIYAVEINWTGNSGTGTNDYRSYERSYAISAENKDVINASSDGSFRGDKTKYNPEDLLVASLSSCHMLWFLHLCSDSGIIVTEYKDRPIGKMLESKNGGKFTEITLYPQVTVSKTESIEKLNDLHVQAHKLCFIANSVNFPVYLKGSGKVAIHHKL